MSEDVEMVEVIIREIRKAAEEEIKRILSEAEKEAKRIVEEAKVKAKELREEKIRQLLHEHRSKIEREYAPKRLEIKRSYIKNKYEKLLSYFNEILSEVSKDIRNNKEEYTEFLKNVMEKAFTSIKSDVIVVHPCKGETTLVKEIIEPYVKSNPSLKGKSYAIGEEIDCDGGLFFESKDKREYYNGTMKAKITEIRETLLPVIAEKLLSDL
ncbi:MAG: hypothetical protein DRJ35_04960 [Thermoprotei archaeon]|nr:MAG: hypothetical protein DRJ35_04960 [Thermoprotei archaeon]